MTVLPYIFYFILQLIILLILVNLSRRFLILVSKNNVNQKKYLFYFDVSVYLVWILFVMLKIAHALNDNLIVIGSVVLVLIILMWDYLKNLFLGIIFAFQYGYIKGVNLIINNIESKLESYYSSYFEILTNKGERLKIKYQNVYAGNFEIFKGNLHRVFKKIKIPNSEFTNDLQIRIMNHPLFLINSNYDFYEERDQDGSIWLCFFFNVMNYKDALIIEEYIDNINNSEMDKLI